MHKVIEQLDDTEIKVICKVANDLMGADIYHEKNDIIDLCAPSLDEHIKEIYSKLSGMERLIANNILMKIQWEYHHNTVGESDMIEDDSYTISTRVGNIYPMLSLHCGNSLKIKTGLFKLNALCGYNIKNGQDIVLGEFIDLIDPSHTFTIWFYPAITHSIINN